MAQGATEIDITYTGLVSTDQRGHIRARVHSRIPSGVHQGFRSAEGLARWLPEAMRLVNQVKAAETSPEPVLQFWSAIVCFLYGVQTSKGGYMLCARGPLGALSMMQIIIFLNLESAYWADSAGYEIVLVLAGLSFLQTAAFQSARTGRGRAGRHAAHRSQPPATRPD